MPGRIFAVAGLGKDRWYWVVWPSVEEFKAEEPARPHLAQGVEKTKAKAVEQALRAAGRYGRWVEARHAREYHRQLSQRERGKAAPNQPVPLEFLYHDAQDTENGEWFSRPHRVLKKTRQYVYVEQQPFDQGRGAAGWMGAASATFRLSRKMLETEGYALTPILDIDDPLFFTAPIQERTLLYTRQPPVCFQVLGLAFPCTKAEVTAAYRRLALKRHPDQGGNLDQFIELQAAYDQALRLCRE
jgi:hypothetical protein